MCVCVWGGGGGGVNPAVLEIFLYLPKRNDPPPPLERPFDQGGPPRRPGFDLHISYNTYCPEMSG